MTTYVCNILCALYNIPTTQGKFIFFRAYMVFLCFHNHCNLALLGSEAQGSICESCPTNLASFLGFLGFFMDLLVLDSIWIYLFSLWPYGPICYLCSEGGTLHYSFHCDSTTLLNQVPSPKGSAGAVCWLGVFSVKGGDNKQLQQHQGKVIFLL